MSIEILPLAPAFLDQAQALLEAACAHDDVAGLGREKLFAPGSGDLAAEPLAAFEGEQLVGVACTSGKWLRLLAVAPDRRCQGVGSELLERCHAQIASHGAVARTMDQPGNYLSPGVDNQNRGVLEWLSKRGYTRCGKACNLLINVQDNALVSQEKFEEMRSRVHDEGYEIARLPWEKLVETADHVATNFSEGWKHEMTRSATHSQGVHIALVRNTGQLAGFAAHDGNNAGRGWFGPTGTLPAHRGKGLGAALLLASLLDIRNAGHRQCQVAWVGPRAFYYKIAGIASERTFTVLHKDL
ncbi:MAG: GNAT family N-acetyltransferase [Myxococcales bacterium]|nr:GNAT family N-acetyltransferase [Myxococcales bacterium]